MSRVEQLNSLLQQELASLISQYIPIQGGLVTVTHVRCSPDLREVRVGISVLPEKFSGSTLRELKKHNHAFSEQLRKRLKIRRIPYFRWEIDMTESEAAKLDEIFQVLQ